MRCTTYYHGTRAVRSRDRTSFRQELVGFSSWSALSKGLKSRALGCKCHQCVGKAFRGGNLRQYLNGILNGIDPKVTTDTKIPTSKPQNRCDKVCTYSLPKQQHFCTSKQQPAHVLRTWTELWPERDHATRAGRSTKPKVRTLPRPRNGANCEDHTQEPEKPNVAALPRSWFDIRVS